MKKDEMKVEFKAEFIDGEYYVFIEIDEWEVLVESDKHMILVRKKGNI